MALAPLLLVFIVQTVCAFVDTPRDRSHQSNLLRLPLDGGFGGEPTGRSLDDVPSPEPTRAPTSPGSVSISEIERPFVLDEDEGFGIGMSVDGNDLAVISETNIYFFEESMGDWSLVASFSSRTLPGPTRVFSFHEVVLQGERAVVSTNARSLSGRVVAFYAKRVIGWHQVQTLACPSCFRFATRGPDNFGSSLALTLNGRILAIGADMGGIQSPGSTSTKGLVHVYRLLGTIWQFKHTLEGFEDGFIGSRIVFSNTHMVVGTHVSIFRGDARVVKFPFVRGLPQAPFEMLSSRSVLFSNPIRSDWGQRVFHHAGFDLCSESSDGSGFVYVFEGTSYKQRLGPISPERGEGFGAEFMASRGDLLFIPSRYKRVSSAFSSALQFKAGAVYIFKVNAARRYEFVTTIFSPIADALGQFGLGIASSEADTFIAGPFQNSSKGRLYHISIGPTPNPTKSPTRSPTTSEPSSSPVTSEPTTGTPSIATLAPSSSPSWSSPTTSPSVQPTRMPTPAPTSIPMAQVSEILSAVAGALSALGVLSCMLGYYNGLMRTSSCNGSEDAEDPQLGPQVVDSIPQARVADDSLQYATEVSQRFAKNAILAEQI